MEYNTNYRGVNGWLSFFCILLVFLTPLATLFTIIKSYSELNNFFSQYRGLKTVFVLDTVVSFIITIFSVHAGISLYSIKPNAVKIAKRYLIINLGYHFFAAIIPFTAGLPSYAEDAMVPEAIKSTVQGFIGFSIWFSYLNNSKRVKATYYSYPEMTQNDYLRSGYEYPDTDTIETMINLNREIRLNPSNAKAFINRGNALVGLKNFKKAVEDYTKAIELEKNKARAFTNRGFAYEKLKEYDKAIEDYKAAISILPNFAAFYDNLGHAYLRSKDYSNAVSSYRKCIELDSKRFSAMLGLAEAYYETEDAEKSKHYLDEAKTIEPRLSEGMSGIEKLEKEGWNFSEEDKLELTKLFG